MTLGYLSLQSSPVRVRSCPRPWSMRAAMRKPSALSASNSRQMGAPVRAEMKRSQKALQSPRSLRILMPPIVELPFSF
jgi:hypothetical protein